LYRNVVAVGARFYRVLVFCAALFRTLRAARRAQSRLPWRVRRAS